MLETLKFGEGNWANKTDSTLAYSDQYGNFQAIPFDFTRATTATRVNKAGLIESVNEGIARIDYSDSTQGALLLEPERTNLITQSELFSSGSSWLTAESTITNNYGKSPSGNNDASRWLSDLGSTNSVITSAPTVSDNTTYTISLYVKSNGNNKDVFRLLLSSGADGLTSNDLTATSEWQRFTYSGTRLTTGTRFGLLFPSDNSEVDVQIWGAQLEQGSYSTSYIPTTTTTVTRNGEFASNSNILSSMGQTEGTMFIDVISAEKDTEILSFNRSSQNAFFLYTNPSNDYRVQYYLDGQIRNSNTLISGNQRIKIAVAYEDNNQRLYVNGALALSYTDSWTPNVAMDRIYFNQGGFISARGKSNISALQVFKTPLTDAQLQTLTTI